MKSLISALNLLLITVFATAQIDSHVHQLQLIDSVRSYIQNVLHLNVGDDFYKKWSTRKDSMYYYLYVSEANKIQSMRPNTSITKMCDVEDSAIAAANSFNKHGYQTLVYKTSGTSNAELTPKLLDYPDEAIAFIMVHEAVHQHIASLRFKPRYPYNFEECLCDAVANKACVTMAKKLKLFDLKATIRQKKIFEKAFAYLNTQRERLDSSGITAQAKIFKQSTSRIKSLVCNGNQFQKDRMIYEVNNAYFLRIGDYATHYFEVKQMLNRRLTISGVIKKIYKREIKTGTML